MARESTGVTENTTGPASSDPRLFGSWPDVNVEVVSDYQRSEKKVTGPRKFLRIHIDLPMQGSSDLEDLRTALDAGDHKAARTIARKLMGAATPNNARARGVLEAALAD